MNAIPLSPVDYIFTGVGSQPITFAFSYPTKIDPEVLQNSLTETLDHFPILRSQLKKISENDYEFHISDETIRSYLADVKQEHNVSVTKNDVIAALLWKKYIPMWNDENDNPKTYVTCPFDFRRVLTDFPKNYFGCALCFATASIDLNDLLKASIGDLAILIRNSVSKIKNDHILNSLSTLQSLRKQYGLAAMEKVHLRHPHHGMIITNLTRLPIRDIDFGVGAPVDFLAYAEVMASAAILPANKGIEIFIVHPPKGN